MSFNEYKWSKLIEKTQVVNRYEKGRALEDLADYLFSCIEGIKVTGRNIRYFTEEIDLCFCNYSNDALLWELGSVVLVECKNHKSKIPVKTIRNLSCIMEMKGISYSILVTTSNLTKAALKEVDKLRETNKNIIVILLDDIVNIKKSPIDILKEKIIENNI